MVNKCGFFGYDFVDCWLGIVEVVDEISVGFCVYGIDYGIDVCVG